MDENFGLLKSYNLDLKYVEGKGRCLFTTTFIKKGDTVFEEEPLISCQFAWNKIYNYDACDYCMRPLESVEENLGRLTGNKCFDLPFLEFDPTIKSNHKQCINCKEKYCSEKCLLNAWNQYHKYLCSENSNNELLNLIEYWKEIHYPPETTNIMLLIRLICTIHSSSDNMTYSTIMQNCHSSTNEDRTITLKLLGENFQSDIDILWNLFRNTITSILSSIPKNSFVDSLITREGFIKMFSLIGRNGQGIGTSVLAEWTKKVINISQSSTKISIDQLIDSIYAAIDQHSGAFVDNEGSGLYVLQSCINHSCVANVKVTFPFNCNKLAIIAKRDIMPGEEILINYLDKCSRKRSCHSRRRILKENYLFWCTCAKCITESSNEPDVTSEEDDMDSDNDYNDV